jgi:hypothetical protein
MVEPNGIDTHEAKGASAGAKMAAAKAVGARTSGKANGPGPVRRETNDAGADAHRRDEPAGQVDPSLVLLPYFEVSRALLRAHHNALAMMEANRALADSLRTIVRRQQDVAFEIAEQAMNAGKAGSADAQRDAGVGDADARATVFHRAAEAVRELGGAVIAAQLNALGTLRDRARGAESGLPIG